MISTGYLRSDYEYIMLVKQEAARVGISPERLHEEVEKQFDIGQNQQPVLLIRDCADMISARGLLTL